MINQGLYLNGHDFYVTINVRLVPKSPIFIIKCNENCYKHLRTLRQCKCYLKGISVIQILKITYYLYEKSPRISHLHLCTIAQTTVK